MPRSRAGSASGAWADTVTVPSCPNAAGTASSPTGRSRPAPGSSLAAMQTTVADDASEQLHASPLTTGEPNATVPGRRSVTWTPTAGSSPVFATRTATWAGDPSPTVAPLGPVIARAAGRCSVNGTAMFSAVCRPQGESCTESDRLTTASGEPAVSRRDNGTSARAATAPGRQVSGWAPVQVQVAEPGAAAAVTPAGRYTATPPA